MFVEFTKSRRLHLVTESRFISDECSGIAAVRSLSSFCNYLPHQLRSSPSPALEDCSNLTTSLSAESGRCSDVIECQQTTQVRNRDNVRAGCKSPPPICKVVCHCRSAGPKAETTSYLHVSALASPKSYNTAVSYFKYHAVSIKLKPLQHALYPDSKQSAVSCWHSRCLRS